MIGIHGLKAQNYPSIWIGVNKSPNTSRHFYGT